MPVDRGIQISMRDLELGDLDRVLVVQKAELKLLSVRWISGKNDESGERVQT